MQWSDEGVVLGTRKHGETSLIVELMTPAHGRHLGLVRGGRSRRQLPGLQAGNTVNATWRARLHEHLGQYAIEVVRSRAAELIESEVGLYTVQTLGTLLRYLPERDPHPALYDALCAILDLPAEPELVGAMIVRFELRVLEDLGFGLDLESCAGGGNGDLVFVSPKTGRAVSRDAGEPYADRLLILPPFLIGGELGETPPAADVAAGFRLTEFFLNRHVLEPRGLPPAEARAALVRIIRRRAA